MPLPFLKLNPGDVDELDVEIQTGGAAEQFDSSGIDRERSVGGTLLMTMTFDRRRTYPGLQTKWLTTTEYKALVAAAKFPNVINVSGFMFRNDNLGGANPTISAVVEVTEADYAAVGEDWLHIAHISIEQAD